MSRSSSGDEKAHLRDIKGREMKGLTWSKYIDEEGKGEVSNKLKISILALWANCNVLVGTQTFNAHHEHTSMCVPILYMPSVTTRVGPNFQATNEK